MLSGEWLGPCQARSMRSPPISSVRRSPKVSSFGGRAGSSSRSSSCRVSSCPMRVTFLSNSDDGADVVGVVVRVDEVLDLVADAVGGGDLVDRALDVVADRRRGVEQHDAVGGGEERRLVGAVGDPVEVPLDAADVVALLVQRRAERRPGDRRVVGEEIVSRSWAGSSPSRGRPIESRKSLVSIRSGMLPRWSASAADGAAPRAAARARRPRPAAGVGTRGAGRRPGAVRRAGCRQDRAARGHGRGGAGVPASARSVGVEGEMELAVRGAAAAVLAEPRSPGARSRSRSATRSRSRSG